MNHHLLAILRESAARDRVVWRDVSGACCLCGGPHQHHGPVTAAQLADLVEAGDERATERLRSIVTSGLAMAVLQSGG